MKEIYYTLKETKFLEPIRSLKIRSIPHESLKAVFLYTEWIYTLFYEDILTDTREIPQNHEIKYTHFHNSNWYIFILIFFYSINLGWMGFLLRTCRPCYQ